MLVQSPIKTKHMIVATKAMTQHSYLYKSCTKWHVGTIVLTHCDFLRFFSSPTFPLWVHLVSNQACPRTSMHMSIVWPGCFVDNRPSSKIIHDESHFLINRWKKLQQLGVCLSYTLKKTEHQTLSVFSLPQRSQRASLEILEDFESLSGIRLFNTAAPYNYPTTPACKGERAQRWFCSSCETMLLPTFFKSRF